MKDNTQPKQMNTVDTALRERILSVDTTYDLGDHKTEEFLPPNFYIDRLVDLVSSLTNEAELRGRQSELKKWRTMVERLSAYVDSPDSLTEFDDRIEELAALLKLSKGATLGTDDTGHQEWLKAAALRPPSELAHGEAERSPESEAQDTERSA